MATTSAFIPDPLKDYLLTGQETSRLSFHANARDEFDLWLPFFKDPVAVGFVGLSSFDTPESACHAWYDKVEDRILNRNGGMNVLREKSTGAYVGQCGLLIQEVDGKPLLEIGYSLLPGFRGKGYATEAAQKCRDVAFDALWSDRLHSIIHIENAASAAVARKNGMQVLRRTEFWGMPVDLFYIDRNEWLK